MTEVLNNGTNKNRIPLSNDDDTLPFEDQLDTFEEKSPSESVIKLPSHERVVVRYERPATLEENTQRIRREDIARQAIRPLTAYEELGGGLYGTYAEDNTPSERMLDGVIRTIGDKAPEVREAVERFGLNELTLAQYQEGMNETQRKHFIIAFQKFYNLALIHAKRIRNVEGDVSLDRALLKYHGIDQPTEEVREYGKYLEALLAAMDGTGIPAQVMLDVQKFYKNKHRLSGVLEKADHRQYQLTFKVDSHGQKIPMRDSHRLSA